MEEEKCTNQSVFFERSLKNSSRPRSSDISHTTGLLDVIRKSVHKDLQGVSVRERAKQWEKKNNVLKPIDTPRPRDMSTFKELEESLRILIKLKELPQNFHQFSCDGNNTIKHRDHRRLSLDSMECSKFSSVMNELDENTTERIYEASNLIQVQESNENNPSIVENLMGLKPLKHFKGNGTRSHDSFNHERNRKTAQESKYDKPLQFPGNSPKFQRNVNPPMKPASNSRLMHENTQQKMALGLIETNTKKKIVSVNNDIRKTVQKVQFQHDRRAVKETGKWNLRKVSSLNQQFSQLNNKSNKATISERALKSPIAVMKPAGKSSGISSSSVTELIKGPSVLPKIRTNGSTCRKKEAFSVRTDEKSPTAKKGNRKSNSLSKETNGRAVDDTTSPILKKKVSYQEKHFSTATPFDLKKSRRQSGNGQQSESVLPSCRIRHKPNKTQYNEHQNSDDQMNAVTMRTNSSTQGKSKNTIDSASVSKQKNQMIQTGFSTNVLKKVAPKLSSPNSVLDASLYQDDLLLCPLLVSGAFKAQDENLPSENIKINMLHHPATLQPTLSYRTDSHKSDRNQMLHKQLFFDVVNEILARRTMAFNSSFQYNHLLQHKKFMTQHHFKELCLEIKCLQSPGDGSMHTNMDSILAKDLLQRSKAWDSFDSKVLVIVIEIERLIFTDLANEISGFVTSSELETWRRPETWKATDSLI